MKYITGILVIIAAVAADVSHLPSNEYLPPGSNHESPVAHYPAPVSRQYLAPVQAAPEHHAPVHHVAPEHHAPVVHVAPEHHAPVFHVAPEHYAPVAHVAPQHHAPVVHVAPEHHAPVFHVEPEHHTPVDVSNDYLPPLSNTVEEAKPAHEVHDDGYVYKNPVEERLRAKRRYRLRYRHRRY